MASAQDRQPGMEPTADRDTESAGAAVTTRKEVEDDLAEVLRQIKELLTDNSLAGTKRPPPAMTGAMEKRRQTMLEMRWARPHQLGMTSVLA
ncbi:hypothetical protein T02_9072 [Trichinella nativa]|uniref:Uncharacterized protein n=1 Tax=Trichinella nativa TaxID=6335 RepID=A0A0V1KRS2_9BILA|nr:hypothetical protein T02_9072 [Trichinella nativa]